MHVEDGLYECILTLPPNAVLQRIVGPPSINAHLAKQLASLEACKKLHELEALNDHLLPLHEEPIETSITGTDKDCASGAGIILHPLFVEMLFLFFLIFFPASPRFPLNMRE